MMPLNQTSVSVRVFGFMVVCILLGATRASAQDCTQGNTTDYVAYGGQVESDSKIHFWYRIHSSVPAALKDAINEAISRWNAQSGSSKMVLDAVNPSLPSQELLFTMDNGIGDPCAEFGGGGTEIKMRTALSDLAAADSAGFEWAVGTVAHEIGHYYRLADMGSNWGTIIGNPGGATCADMKADWEQGNGPTNVPASLADAGQACVDEFRETYADSYVVYDPPYMWDIYGQPCYDHYWVTEYWYCYDGCTYAYSDYEYLGCW